MKELEYDWKLLVTRRRAELSVNEPAQQRNAEALKKGLCAEWNKMHAPAEEEATVCT
jgi:hypothetical protein